jgi:hypothetical protein
MAFWFFGLGVAIAVNKVSNSQQAIKIIVIAVVVAAAIAGWVALDAVAKSSYLRYYIPYVLLALATPLILLAAVGVWGDYTMVIAAALVAVASLTAPHDTMTRFCRLAGMTLLGAGILTVSVPIREPMDGVTAAAYPIGLGAFAIACGAVLAIKGGELFGWMGRLAWRDHWRLASQGLFMGLLLAAVTVTGISEVFPAPGGIAVTVLMIGATVVLIGSSGTVLLDHARRQWIARQWSTLRRERGPGERYPAFKELVIRGIRFVTDWLRRLEAAYAHDTDRRRRTGSGPSA